MLQFLVLFGFFVTCFANIPIGVGILYSSEDPLAEIAIRHIEVRFTIMTNYSLKPYKIDIKDQNSFETQQSVCSMIENGIFAIVGPTSEEVNVAVQSVSENFEIPQLQTFWNPGSLANTNQVLNLHPDPTLLAKALATLVRHMNWKSFVIIYENDDSLIRLQEVLQIKRESADDFPVTIRKFLTGPDQSPLLKEIKDRHEVRIILDCKTERILDVLLQAQKLNMLEVYRSYILTSLDAHTLDFSQLVNNGTNITTLRFLDTTRRSFRNVIKDWIFMEQQENREIIIKPESIKLSTALLYDAIDSFFKTFEDLSHIQPFRLVNLSCYGDAKASNEWRVVDQMKIRPMQNGILAELLTGPLEFDSFGNRKNFKLQIVEWYNETLRTTGEWLSDDPDHIKYLLPSSNPTKHFANAIHPLRVASKPGLPYLVEIMSNETGKKHYDGYVADLIKYIATAMDFQYEFYIVPDKKYGNYDQDTKEWNGLIREILERNADLAVCDLTMTYERGTAVDFSVPFMNLGISILYTKSKKEPPALFSFMKPLSAGIWLYMATAYLVISIIIYFAARLTPSEWESSHPCDENPSELENIWNLKNTFWLTLGSIMAQGSDLMPKGISTRMITSMWWFFSLILTSSYTANLAAFLTNERMESTIESVDDLASRSDIKYGCVLGGATAVFFRDSNFSTFQKMWRTMEQGNSEVFLASNKEGVKKVKEKKGKFAFLMESSTIEYERERDCDLINIGNWLDTKGYGIAMPNDSPYRKDINEVILRLQENGTIRKLKEKWWKERDNGGQCEDLDDTKKDTAAELGIDNVGGIFMVLTIGVFLAFFIAIFEFLWNIRKISVQEQMTPAEAFAREIKFALKVSQSKKIVSRKKMPVEETQS